MTKTEKAKEIIRQGGECRNLPCDEAKNNECVCYEWCKSNNCGTCCPEIDDMHKRIEICEKYLGENAVVEKQLFDKSKVLVAGIHEVDTQMLYIVGNNISELNGKIDGDNAFNPRKLKSYNDLYLCERGNTWQFAYPYEEPAKTWRPIKTIEEARTLRGKWLISKTGKIEFLVTRIAYFDAGIYINDSIRSDVLFDQYTMEDGSPVGIEE